MMRLAFTVYALIMLAWIGAWRLHDSIGLSAEAAVADTLYWTVAKAIIWLLPVVVVVRGVFKRRLTEYLSLGNVTQGVKAGCIYGIAFVAISFMRDYFMRSFGWPAINPGLLNALAIAPICEEVLFRGFFLRTMQESKLGFWPANILTALLFLGMHLPGWYFMASPNLTQPFAMIGIVLVGLVAGVARQRSGSLWGSISVHFVNNLYSSFLH